MFYGPADDLARTTEQCWRAIDVQSRVCAMSTTIDGIARETVSHLDQLSTSLMQQLIECFKRPSPPHRSLSLANIDHH